MNNWGLNSTGRVRSDLRVLRSAVIFALEADSEPVDDAEGGGLGAGGTGTDSDGGHHAVEHLPLLTVSVKSVCSNKQSRIVLR